MTVEQSRLHTTALRQEKEEEEEAGRTISNDKSRPDAGISEANPAQSLTPAVKLSSMNQEPDGLMCDSQSLFCLDTLPLPPLSNRGSHGQGPVNEFKLSPVTTVQSSPKETFNSSFSFIQQSLKSFQTAETPLSQEPEPVTQLKKTPNSPMLKCPVQFLPSATSGDPADSEDLPSCGRFWQSWERRGIPPDTPDCDAVDIEIISSFSVDSDNGSTSSVTSGYESATPASDQSWDSLVKKYEGVLQDCLQNNRTYTKVGMAY